MTQAIEVLFIIFIAVIGLIFLPYLPQLFYFVRAFFTIKKYPRADARNKYCILIAAKNEQKVIANLIDSINKQDYPRGLIDIYVVADNCADSTAQIASEMGAVVFERNEKESIGKGHALTYAINQILSNHSDKEYKGIFFFDADNVLNVDYISRMNDAIESGETILTSYRNCKNYGKSWVADCSALIFLRENRIIHPGRISAIKSTVVAGTGFYTDMQYLQETDGWIYHLLTEDLEFSCEQILNGRKIGYVYDAEFFDEQPEKMKDSMSQRNRWIKGAYECYDKYSSEWYRGLFSSKRGACFEMLAFAGPWPAIATIWALTYIFATFGLCLAVFSYAPQYLIIFAVTSAIVAGGYIVAAWLFAFMLTFFERKRVYNSKLKQAFAIFMFPFYLLTFLPITVSALFSKRKWYKVEHIRNYNIKDIVK